MLRFLFGQVERGRGQMSRGSLQCWKPGLLGGPCVVDTPSSHTSLPSQHALGRVINNDAGGEQTSSLVFKTPTSHVGVANSSSR